MKISTYLTLRALVHSDTAKRLGMSNRPPAHLVKNIRLLALGLDCVRRLVGRPLAISSGYRNAALNRLVRGSPRSRHQLGLAADFVCPQFGSAFELCRTIARAGIPFEQMIYEFGDGADRGWVHISFGRGRKRKMLTIRAKDGRYKRGIHPSLRR